LGFSGEGSKLPYEPTPLPTAILNTQKWTGIKFVGVSIAPSLPEIPARKRRQYNSLKYKSRKRSKTRSYGKQQTQLLRFIWIYFQYHTSVSILIIFPMKFPTTPVQKCDKKFNFYYSHYYSLSPPQRLSWVWLAETLRFGLYTIWRLMHGEK